MFISFSGMSREVIRTHRGASDIEIPAEFCFKNRPQIFEDFDKSASANSNSSQQRVLKWAMFCALVRRFMKGLLKDRSDVHNVSRSLLFEDRSTLETSFGMKVHDITIFEATCTCIVLTPTSDFINFGARNYIKRDEDSIHEVNYVVLSRSPGRFGTADTS